MSQSFSEPKFGANLEVSEWRRGWPIVLLGVLGIGIALVHVVSLGFMLGALRAEHGWTSSQITGSLLVYNLALALTAPFAGQLIDRFSERVIAVPAVSLLCLGVASLSLAGSTITGWWVTWGALGVVASLCSITFWTTVISRRFKKHLGLALAIVLCGSSVGAMLMPAVTHVTMAAYGWRATYVIFGVAGAVLLIPSIAIFLKPVGSKRQTRVDRAAIPKGMSAKEALRSRSFPRLVAAAIALAMISTGFLIHLVPLLLSKQVDASAAAAAAGLYGFGSIVGRLTTGMLLDRYVGRKVGAFAFAFPVLPCVILCLTGEDAIIAMVAGFLLGVSSGAETDVISYLTARYFGVSSFARISGIIAIVVGVFAGISPLCTSLVVDATSSYLPMLVFAICLSVVAAAAVWNLGSEPSFQNEG